MPLGKKAPPPAPGEPAAPGSAAAASLSDDDLARCVAVLNLLSEDLTQLDTPRFRPLRKALGPAHVALSERDAAVLEYGRQRQLRKEEEARRAQRAAMDAKHMDTTGLRKGRISRLKELCEQGGGGGAGATLAIGMEGGDGGGDGDGAQEEACSDGGLESVRYLCQVPDGAVREEPEPASNLQQLVIGNGSHENGHGESVPGSSTSLATTSSSGPELFRPRQCYTCKARFHALHHFYASLCPKCAALNFRMRHLTADLRGRVALLTGSRVKIGFEIGLKLLRAGATLIATTRFPADAAARYAAMPDFEQWRGRLQLHAVDLRDVASLEAFCDFLHATLPRLDVIINNACQTVRRPASYYSHLLEAEATMEAAVRKHKVEGAAQRLTAVDDAAVGAPSSGAPLPPPPATAAAAAVDATGEGGKVTMPSSASDLLPLFSQQASRAQWSQASSAITWVGDVDDDGGAGQASGAHALLGAPSSVSPAQLSQLRLAPEDHLSGEARAASLPPGRLDVNGQQIDLRKTNSWLLKMNDVSTPELVEVFAINTLAPFLLNARLQPLLAATAAGQRARAEDGTGEEPSAASPDASGAVSPGAAFIVNVSAMEGKFYRHKTPNHPHTNMAKAALNMMTRTSAAELAESHRIFMTAVDTGWINDENPRERAARTAASASRFQTPIDEVDAAARVLHPVFEGVASGKPVYGVFLKDYAESEW